MIALTMALATGAGRAQQPAPAADEPPLTSELIAKGITPPKPINIVDAHFSDEARRKKISGRCLVSLTVDVNGMPQEISVVRCTDPSFEATSLEAVQQYRFKPATTQEGKPIAIKIEVDINYRLIGHSNPPTPIHYGFNSPPGITTSEPGPDGVYPLTSSVTPPTMTRFSDKGYGDAAFSAKNNGACDIVLTISVKGKASDAVVTHCEWSSLEKPAVQSLLQSHYKPGSVNGKAVPIRASIHLEYGGVSPKP
jgi:TonB family protein